MKLNFNAPPPTTAEIKIRKVRHIITIGLSILVACASFYMSGFVTSNALGLTCTGLTVGLGFYTVYLLGQLFLSGHFEPLSANLCDSLVKLAQQSASIRAYIAAVNAQGRELIGAEFTLLNDQYHAEKDSNRNHVIYKSQ